MWYVDADGDGYTVDGSTVFNCNNPGLNYVATSLGVDCDDADATAWRIGTFYVDADGDSYRLNTPFAVCYGNSAPTGYILASNALGIDCNDADALLYDEVILYVDADGDGYSPEQDFVCVGATTPAGYSVTTLGYDYCDNDPLAWNTATVRTDSDGDGYSVGTGFSICYGAALPSGLILAGQQLGSADCDDTDPAIFESVLVKVDADGDGYSVGTSQTICIGNSIPSGYVAAASSIGEDCDDSDASVYQTILIKVDTDGDGYSVGISQSACIGATVPSGYVATSSALGTDCDDSNAAVFANAILYVDSDGDGRTVGGSSIVCIGGSIPSGYSQTTLGSDCNDTDASVWQSNTFYTDTDGDGYHGSAATICYGNTVPAGSTTTLGADCNDANSAISPGANEACDDLVDNDCDGVVDEFCNSLIGNDSPTYATNVVYSSNMNFPNCYSVNGDLTGSSDSPQSAAFTGPDEWYKFTAISTAVSVTLSGSGQNDAIALYSKSGSNYILVASENAATGNGDFERLNQGGLTPGTQYYISVGAASGTTGGAYTLCIQNLVQSDCANDIPAAGFNLCNTFKAVYRGSTSQGVTYNFGFTGVGGGATGTSSVSGTNLVTLSNPVLGLRYGGIYDVLINVNYALQDGAGATENIVVSGNVNSLNCNDVTIMAQPGVAVRSDQRCPASLTRGTYLN
ncbi:MAG: MopE-related protein, partial [Armatimonadota bacterium]